MPHIFWVSNYLPHMELSSNRDISGIPPVIIQTFMRKFSLKNPSIWGIHLWKPPFVLVTSFPATSPAFPDRSLSSSKKAWNMWSTRPSTQRVLNVICWFHKFGYPIIDAEHFMENPIFKWMIGRYHYDLVNLHILDLQSYYPLANVYITMEHHHFFIGKSTN